MLAPVPKEGTSSLILQVSQGRQNYQANLQLFTIYLAKARG